MADTQAATIAAPDPVAPPASNSTKATSGVAQFARNAVSAQVGRVSEILNASADSIDELLGGSNSPLPDSARGFVTSTSGKLRDLADRATEEEAGKLLENLQRTAAEHPAATAGLGAALGAALGLALAKLGGSAPSPSSSSTKKRAGTA